MTEQLVLFASVYFGTGALIGQFHLLRCASCSGRFSNLGQYAKYIAASAMVGLPMTLWGFVAYGLGECDE